MSVIAFAKTSGKGMAHKRSKPETNQSASAKSDEQIISELMESRKRQMEALLKIMSSMDEPDPKPIPSTEEQSSALGRFKKKLKRRTNP
jgi:hypothetical protein